MSVESNYRLQLFINGESSTSRRAVANIEQICEVELGGEVEVEIIDVQQDPESAERAKVLATPTLVKQLPPPLRRVIGDLTDRGIVLAALGITI